MAAKAGQATIAISNQDNHPVLRHSAGMFAGIAASSGNSRKNSNQPRESPSRPIGSIAVAISTPQLMA